jgi:hypothetical protein
LAFFYWIDNLGFITEGKLAAIFFTPSLGVPNWPVIYFINYTPTSSLALLNIAPSKAIIHSLSCSACATVHFFLLHNSVILGAMSLGVFPSSHRAFQQDVLRPFPRKILLAFDGARKEAADAKLTCSRQSLCVVNDQPVGNPKRKV